MLRKNLPKFIILLVVLGLGYFYYRAVAAVDPKALVEIKETVQSARTSNMQFTLDKNAYILRIYHSGIYKKDIYFNNSQLLYSAKLGSGTRGDYLVLPKEIVNDGVNVLRVSFPDSFPDNLIVKIRSYYFSVPDCLYVFPWDTTYLPRNKGLQLKGLYKIVVSRTFFWFILVISIITLTFLNLIKVRYFGKNSVLELNKPDRLLKDHKINYIGNIILFGFMSSVLFHIVKSIVAGNVYPNNTFLYFSRDRFLDFINVYNQCKGLNPYFTDYVLRSVYFPFANIFIYPFTFLPNLESLILYLTIFILFFISINASSLTMSPKTRYLKNLAIFTFLTYPFLFVVDRANVEIIVFMFLFLFLYYYSRKEFFISTIFLSFAIAIKGFPAVFLVLLLSDKKYKEVIITVTLTVLLTFLSLLFHKGGFFLNLNYVLTGFNYNSVSYLCQNNNMVQRGVSLFALAKMYFIQTGKIASIDMSQFLGMYTKVIIPLFFLFSGYIMFIEKDLWKKVMVLVAAALIFPHVSADYKLIYIFIPMFMFINSDKKSSFDLFYIAIFGLLLMPKDYYIFPKIISDTEYSDISIAVVLNILLLIAIVALIMFEGLSARLTKQRMAG